MNTKITPSINIEFMRDTIKIAMQNPVAPYGTIIVYDGLEILISSVNESNNNPLMHGELAAIHKLFENGFQGDRNKLSLYTTAEPCPMCASAIYWSGIPNVIFGSSIPFLNKLFGRQINIRAAEIFANAPNFYTCSLIGGIMENECNNLFIKAKKYQIIKTNRC